MLQGAQQLDRLDHAQRVAGVGVEACLVDRSARMAVAEGCIVICIFKERLQPAGGRCTVGAVLDPGDQLLIGEQLPGPRGG